VRTDVPVILLAHYTPQTPPVPAILNTVQQTTMPVTFTDNYKEVFATETVEKIEELLEDNYCLEDILEFIDQNTEEDFRDYYEEYVTAGEDYGYSAVDAFIEEFGLDCVSSFTESYQGEYSSEAQFAEQFCEDMGYEVPSFVIVDWQATFDYNLQYDYSYVNGYVFNKNF
jgi:hypothetical protein